MIEPIRPAYRVGRYRGGRQELLIAQTVVQHPEVVCQTFVVGQGAARGAKPMRRSPADMSTAAIGPCRLLEESHSLGFSAASLYAPPLPGRTIKLHAAGLLAPWSTAAAEEGRDLSLAPMVAAAWARDRHAPPIPAPYEFDFAFAITWPSLKTKPELGFELPAAERSAPLAPDQPAEAWRSIEPEPASEEPEPEEEAWIPFYVPMPNQPSARKLRLRGEDDFLEPVEAQTELPPLPDEPERPSFLTPRINKPRRSRWDDDEPATNILPGGVPPPTLFRLPSAPAVFGAVATMFVVLSGVALFSVPKSDSGLPSLKVESVRMAIRSRAALRLSEDFRTGLADWQGPANWSKDWSYDQAGFLRPGKFGLWSKSMGLANYKMEFMGQIERKSVGWVFRAADPANYYAAKITLTKPGPLPTASLVHFTVTDGKPGPRVSVPLPFQVLNDTIYQVQVEVKQNQFLARVNGRLVDYWSDNQYKSGGVGFMSEPGELARVRWVRISHRDDLLGRVCSFLTAQAWLPDPGVLSATSYLEVLDPSL